MGGSKETHEEMTEKVIKINEKLASLQREHSELMEKLEEQEGDILRAQSQLEGRITSYNVCYTKLLRVRHQRSQSPLLAIAHSSVAPIYSIGASNQT